MRCCVDYIFTCNNNHPRGWECNSSDRVLSSTHKAMGSIPSTKKKPKKQKTLKRLLGVRPGDGRWRDSKRKRNKVPEAKKRRY
jgi:hypothetical protein